MAATSVSDAPKEAAMVMSIGATTKRSKLLMKAASYRSRGPREDSLDARTFALPASLIRQTPFTSRERAPAPFSFQAIRPHLTHKRRNEVPMSDPDQVSALNRPSCKPHNDGGHDGYCGRQGVEPRR